MINNRCAWFIRTWYCWHIYWLFPYWLCM